MTVNVDPKNVFIIPKFYGGVMSALFTVLIALIGYIYVENTNHHEENIKELKINMEKLSTKIIEAEIRQLSTIDVIEKLHPDKGIIQLVYNQQTKYYIANTRGGGKQNDIQKD